MTDEFDVTKERDLYKEWRPYWTMFADFNEFGPNVLRSGAYLHAHPREIEADFTNRCKRADNYNLIPEIVQTYRGYQFSKAAAREYDGSNYAKQIEQFLNDCNGSGLSLDDFMQHFAYEDALVYGWTELFVDMPQGSEIGDKPVTAQQAANAGLLPYVRSISPLLRSNWGTDQNGNYLWAVLKELGVETETPATEPVGAGTYLVLKRDGWDRYSAEGKDGKFEISGTNTYALGGVPLIPLYHEKSRKFKRFGVSLLNEAAPIAQAILNLISQQEQDIFASFSLLAIQTDSTLDGPNELGTSRIMAYALEAKNAPQYITVPVEHIKIKQEVIEGKIEHMLRKAKLSVALGELSTKTKSGIAGEVERMELFTYLSAMARHMEAAELRMIALVCSWHAGKEVKPADTGYKVHYNDEFTLEAIPELLTLAEKVVNIYKTISPAYVRHTLKRLPHRDLPDGDTVRDEIDKEIDAADIQGMDLIPESQVQGDGDIE